MSRRHSCRTLSLLILLLCSSGLLTVTAQPNSTQPGPATTQPNAHENYERLPFMAQTPEIAAEAAPSAGGLLLRTTGALLLIVGLIVATAWGLRQLGGKNFGNADDPAVELTLLGTLSLGDRRQLSAVRFGDRLLLIGSTAQAITLLAAHDERPRSYVPPMRSVADLLAEEQPPSPVQANFERALALADERLKQQANTGVKRTMQTSAQTSVPAAPPASDEDQ
jgi:flagellar biogenesis protein FliO